MLVHAIEFDAVNVWCLLPLITWVYVACESMRWTMTIRNYQKKKHHTNTKKEFWFVFKLGVFFRLFSRLSLQHTHSTTQSPLCLFSIHIKHMAIGMRSFRCILFCYGGACFDSAWMNDVFSNRHRVSDGVLWFSVTVHRILWKPSSE